MSGKAYFALLAAFVLVALELRPVRAGVICEATVYNANLVRAVQNKLRDAKAFAGSADGRWTPRTGAGIRSYQKKHGLEQTGTLDEPTFRAMFGNEQRYEPVSRVVQNPKNAPPDIYAAECEPAGRSPIR